MRSVVNRGKNQPEGIVEAHGLCHEQVRIGEPRRGECSPVAEVSPLEDGEALIACLFDFFWWPVGVGDNPIFVPLVEFGC